MTYDGHKISKWLQYSYFLRFPLLAWLALPAMCLVDAQTPLNTITRGIMTLSRPWQAFYAAFFVASLMMAVLVCVRNIVKNGGQRFASTPPALLHHVLTSKDKPLLWTVLGVAHIPTIITLAYLLSTTVYEKETWPGPWFVWFWFAYLSGLSAAAAFWYLVSIFYWWIYPHVPGAKPAALFFPPDVPLAQAAQKAPQPRFAIWIAALSSPVLRLTRTGFADPDSAVPYELHALTSVALGAFFLLYLFLYPLTAPVNVNNGHAEMVVALTLFGVIVWGAYDVPTPTRPSKIGKVGCVFVFLCAALLIVFAVLQHVDHRIHRVLMATAFPTIASVLVIAIFLLWLITGVSFLLDRYRVPVSIVTLLVIFGMKALPIDQDHYFEAFTAYKKTDSMTPERVLQARQGEEGPYIIVTASGGGIQAAEWTAQIMTRLEETFARDGELRDRKYTLHEHLLLASGVSGGSDGLMPYLLEYTRKDGFAVPSAVYDDHNKEVPSEFAKRVTLPPACTSLEAVAWGLEYYDLQRLLLTVRIPELQGTWDGAAPDRTWALTRSFARNLNSNDLLCPTQTSPPNSEAKTWLDRSAIEHGQVLTLGQSSDLLSQGKLPAFTFNTTVAETGGRFLLSNYVVPPCDTKCRSASQELSALDLGSDFLPSESYLQAYMGESKCDAPVVDAKCYADIALPTAARLSATFPFVSSATRIPKQFTQTAAAHFLDGGYFDNDGTASVNEFLYSALRDSQPREHPLQILLVEIRDGDDLNPNLNDDDWQHQTQGIHGAAPKLWGTGQQLLSPLMGLWNAGHTSTTRRNRRELCMLENYMHKTNAAEIHHVIFGIPAAPKKDKPGEYETPPLNWKLTAAQLAYIKDWARSPATQSSIDNSLRWVKDVLSNRQAEQKPCQVFDQTYVQ